MFVPRTNCIFVDHFGHVKNGQIKQNYQGHKEFLYLINSKQFNMNSLGEHIRALRVSAGFLLREVAAELAIDPSLLSRIERGEKRPTREQVLALARILRTDRDELLAVYLSDRVLYELEGEKVALRAIQIAEERITYGKTKIRKGGRR